MSYLQALNAGLLETADTVETLATVLSNGNTTSSSINLTGTGSINLTGTGDITLTSGSVEFGTAGAYGSITGTSTDGLVLNSALGKIELNGNTVLNTAPLFLGYQSLEPIGPIAIDQVGAFSSFSVASPSFALTADDTWRLLYTDTNIIPVGVYICNVNLNYTSTDTLQLGYSISFGPAQTTTSLQPEDGLIFGSNINFNNLNSSFPFTSTDTNNTITFSYYGDMPNITVNYLRWTLMRIG